MNTEAYLNRIGYRGSVRPTAEVLHRLHLRHLQSVPFENLDIHLGRPIVLDQKLFYNKIVEKGRGGYCYELNGCFAWLLKCLGFRVSMLSARVAGKTGGLSPDFDHMTLLVRLKERWLADVGFGDSFTEPKQLDSPTAQADNGGLYRIEATEQMRLVERWDEEDSSWRAQYSFGLRPHKLADFARRNRHQQTSPRSHFTQGPLISLLTPTGRITLTGTRFIVTRGKKRSVRRVRNREEFANLLARHFQIFLGRESEFSVP